MFVAGGRLGCVAQLLSSRTSRRVDLLLFAFSAKELRAAAEAPHGHEDLSPGGAGGESGASSSVFGGRPGLDHVEEEQELVLVPCHATVRQPVEQEQGQAQGSRAGGEGSG